MADHVPIEQTGVEPVHVVLKPLPAEPVAQWSLALRIAFRFCFVYFCLFCLSSQIIPELFLIPNISIPELGVLWPLRQITFWTAAHVFHITYPLVYTDGGSGDKTFDWVQVFCLLVMAAIAAAIWSILDRRRQNYITLHKWFRLFIRFVLASEMFVYGFSKVIPLQMPFPPLRILLEPFGNLSPMGVLWWSIGASRAYEIFAGSAEALGGLLLIFPRTTTLGALICLADMVQVFMLNMTYDVPVKLFSFHLIIFSLFLLAPEMRRIISFFFSNRTTSPSAQPLLSKSLRANRVILVAQVVFGLYLVGMNVYSGIHGWHTYGGGRPKPSLYGIWDVEQMSIDNQVRSLLLTDRERWRRLIFDFSTVTFFERLDGTIAGYTSSINDQDKTLTLTRGNDQKGKTVLTFERPAQGQLILDGAMDGHKIHMQLKFMDLNKLTLVNRGFHWINEYPFQR